MLVFFFLAEDVFNFCFGPLFKMLLDEHLGEDIFDGVVSRGWAARLGDRASLVDFWRNVLHLSWCRGRFFSCILCVKNK